MDPSPFSEQKTDRGVRSTVRKHCGKNTRRPGPLGTAGALSSSLSFLPERFTGAEPVPHCTFGTRSSSFSRVTSTYSPRPSPVGRTPESVTPSVGGNPRFSCTLRLSCSLVLHTLPQSPQNVNPRRTFIHLAAEIQKFHRENWSDCGTKFTICSFFRRCKYGILKYNAPRYTYQQALLPHKKYGAGNRS